MRSSSTSTINNSSQIGFSFGAVLGIVAGQYRTLMEAILEAIQNGLDVNATKINVNINQKTRNVHIQDNGDGASKARMDMCLQEIGKSQKSRGKLGQFGIGVVASYNKCKRFQFTSHPRGKPSDCRRWVFDCKTLAKARSTTSVPAPAVSGHVQWWHSELFIENYEASKLKSAIDFDQFCTAVYDRYGAAMLKNKCTIIVKLTQPNGTYQEQPLPPMDFTGAPLPVVSYDSELCGKTTFRMFVVDQSKPKAKGKRRRGQGVRIMDSTGYTLPLTEKVFPCNLLKKKDADLFKSDYFEGEIIFSSKVQLDPSRRFFIEDDPTIEASMHVDQWLNEHGRALIKRMEDEQTTARYRRLGNESMRVIDRFLKDKRNLKLASLIRSFKWGSQGIGHASTPSKKDGTMTGTRSNAGGTGKKRNPSGKGRIRDPDRKPRPKKKDTPLVVNNPGGNPRVYSKHDSTGLVLSYEQGGSDLWKLDKGFGIIRINIIHPTWVAHDRMEGSSQGVRNQLICQLQERIILHVLLSLKLADDLGADLEDILTFYAHEFEDHHQFLSTQGDKIAGRGHHKNKRTKKEAS